MIALGYKGESVKRYFLDYRSLSGSMTVDLARGNVEVHQNTDEDWLVHLIDTGQETNTGGRVRRLEPWLRDDTFMLTYGDGVGNVDLRDLLCFHQAQGRADVQCLLPAARHSV